MKKKLESDTGSNPPACSRSFVLQYRFHDRQFNRWGDWTTIEGKPLREQYGTTVAEWKANCKRWIEMGGRYEYRIIRREETKTWGLKFSPENVKSGGTAEIGCPERSERGTLPAVATTVLFGFLDEG